MKKPLLVIFFSLITFSLFAQFPNRHSLHDSTFSFTGFASSSQTNYPPNFVAYPLTSASSFDPDADLDEDNPSNIYTGPSNLVAGVKNHGASGISFFLTANNQPFGAAMTELDATMRDSIRVSFFARQIYNSVNHVCALRLQYRVGQSGSWLNVLDGSDTVQFVSGLGSTAPSETFTDILLPSNTWGQSIVQVRWVYWEVSGPSGTGFHDRLLLDNITITSELFTPAITPFWRGTTLGNISDSIDFETIAGGVDEYGLNIRGNGYNAAGNGFTGNISISHGTDLEFAWLNRWAYANSNQGFMYDTVYQIFLSAQKVNSFGTNIIGTNGDTFTVRTPASSAAISLQAADCNSNVSNKSELFFCEYNGFASDYQYRFIETATTDTFYAIRGSVNTSMNFAYPWVKLGYTYQVQVRPIFYTDTGSYGASCNVGYIPATINANFKPGSKNITLSSYNQTLELWPVPGATVYRIWVTTTGGAHVDSFDTFGGLSRFKISQRINQFGTPDSVIDYYNLNTQYNFRAKPVDIVRAPGDTIQGVYGLIAQLTMPGSNDMRIGNFRNISLESSNLMVFPNPVTNHEVNIVSDSESTIQTVELYDLQGRKLIEKEFKDQTKLKIPDHFEGLYILRVYSSDGSATNSRLQVIR